MSSIDLSPAGPSHENESDHDTERVRQLQDTLDRDPAQVELYLPLAETLLKLNALSQAEVACRQGLTYQDNQAGLWKILSRVYWRKNNLEEAITACEWALVWEPEQSELYLWYGKLLQQTKQTEKAKWAYYQAIRLDPSSPEGYMGLGIFLKEIHAFAEAEQVFSALLQQRPTHLEGHIQLAAVLEIKKQTQAAEAILERAKKLHPNSADVYYNLGALFELNNRIPEAQEQVNQGLSIDPDKINLNFLAARLDRRSGQFQTGITRLQNLSSSRRETSNIDFLIENELGMSYDRLNQPDQAFYHFSRSNMLQTGEFNCDLAEQRVRYYRYIEKMLSCFSQEWLDRWTPSLENPKEEDPIFLVGFPRSGTTLLGQILDSHPLITTIEESHSPIPNIALELDRDLGNYPADLAEFELDRIRDLRQRYFQLCAPVTSQQSYLFLIDKMPLNLVEAGLILRIFPKARFIFALRHPYDACLSCFMQSFSLNDAMVHFLDLASTATFYDRVMTLWNHYHEVLALNVHYVRYEELVDSFDRVVKDLLAFISVEWDEQVLHFSQHAARRGALINTPSYNQVTEPIYQRARYRWVRYRHYLAPIMPTLLPYTQQFGYPSSAQDI